MTESIQIAAATADAQMRREDFDALGQRSARRVRAFPAERHQLPALIELAKREIPALAAAEAAIFRVHARNQNCIWAVESRQGTIGVFSMLILSEEGFTDLLAGRLDVSDPPDGAIARSGERPSAIYLWAIVTPGVAAESFRTVSNWLSQPNYATADIFTRPTTDAGSRFAANIGFLPVGATGLYRFRRQLNRHLDVTAAVA